MSLLHLDCFWLIVLPLLLCINKMYVQYIGTKWLLYSCNFCIYYMSYGEGKSLWKLIVTFHTLLYFTVVCFTNEVLFIIQGWRREYQNVTKCSTHTLATVFMSTCHECRVVALCLRPSLCSSENLSLNSCHGFWRSLNCFSWVWKQYMWENFQQWQIIYVCG